MAADLTGVPAALRRPPPLAQGDRAVVVAPAGPVDPGRLARGVAVLESLGLRVEVGPHVLDRDARLAYLAGADADRAHDLASAWCDPGVAAVFCARGGYGTLRLLDHLPWETLARLQPKVFVGGSDVTALHLALSARAGKATFFGPVVAGTVLGGGDVPDRASVDGLHSALFTAGPVTVRAAEPHVLLPGRAAGPLTGGTLTLLAAALGSADLTHAAGRIVLLEDVAEAPYRVDRMLTSLLRAGYFDGVTGVALGSWERCGDGVRAVLAERLTPLGVPVLGGLPVGHGSPQLTVPLGPPAMLDADAGTLTAGLDLQA